MKKSSYLFLGILFIFGIYFIGNVSATEGCCMTTKDGQYFKFVDESQCATPDYFKEEISCENAGSFIDDSNSDLSEKGCCIDYNNFDCADSIYRAMCVDEVLNFESSSTELCNAIGLNPNPCQKGCCVVEGIGYYETSMECSDRTNLLGDKDFRDLSESECLLLAHSGDMGACINSNCESYKTRESCTQGDFYFGKYCSDPSFKPLGISCTAHASQGCSDIYGEGDVYWYDSCNQREEIAEGCSSLETKCGLKNNGGYGCVPTSCDVNGNGRYNDAVDLKNGESECIYDGPSGDGTAFAGSVQGKVTCFNGKLSYENCGSFEEGRTAVCRELTTIDTGFTRAICIPNLVQSCFLINLKYFDEINNEEISFEAGMEKIRSECEDNSQCMMLNSKRNESTRSPIGGERIVEKDIGSYFGYEMCAPRDPQTFEIGDGEDATTSCAIATSTCTVYFQKNEYNRYECVENCGCLGKESFEKMNNLCVSMGDCGLDVNIQGTFGKNSLSFKPEGDEGVQRRFADSAIDSYDAIFFKRDVNVAKKVVPQAIEIITELLLDKYNLFLNNGQTPLKVQFPREVMEEILGEEYNTLTEDERQQKMIEFYEAQGESVEDLIMLDQQGWSNSFGSEWNWGSAIEGAAALSLPITSIFALFSPEVINPFYTLWGHDVDTIDIEYTCLDWHAQTGGEECGLCNDGDLPCTAYKCHSLGQECMLINEYVVKADGTYDPDCVSREDDGYAPRIETITSLDEESYSIDETVTNKNWSLSAIGLGTDCIPENSQIEFGLTLDKIAQCKYSFKSYSTYNEMPENYPSNNGFFSEHTFNVNSGMVLDFISEDKEEVFMICIEDGGTESSCLEEAGIDEVDLSLKIRCGDIAGHFSSEVRLNYCISTGPDEQYPQLKSPFSPINKKEWEYNPGNINLKMYLDEMAECRYGYDNALNYESMPYAMTPIGKSNLGWQLNAKLNGSKQGNNQVYIKCRDFSENQNVNGNILYEYTIKRDITYDEYVKDYGLIIDLVSMTNNINGATYFDGDNITTGINPSLDFNVKTSRGANNGVANCYWDTNEKNSMKHTGSSEHSQTYDTYNTDGVRNIYVQCDDGISKVNTTFSFDLTIDRIAPIKIEEVTDGDYLMVRTDEEALCTFSNQDCDFEVNDGKFFYETNYVTEHNTGWNPSLSYHIRCVDKYGNEACVGTVGESASDGPIITRIIYSGNDLKIKTDRKSSCYYSTSICDFDVDGDASTAMSAPLTQEHSLRLGDKSKYYIKCQDSFGNVNPSCTSINVF